MAPNTQAAGQTLSNGQTITATVLTETERRIIQDWFNQDKTSKPSAPSTTPTNETKKSAVKEKKNKGHKDTSGKGLPPGIAKNLARGKPLPPGIAKRQLPVNLNNQLPQRTAEAERVIVGADVLLVEKATGIILDILENVVR